MSLNLNNISVRMTDVLDKAVVEKPVTGFLADNNLRGKFVGAKTVMIPEMNVSGLGNYDRDTGFVNGTVSVSATPFTLAMDRGRSFRLDREDHDESGVADLAGQILGEFVRTQVVPEIDAYVLSKLAGYAVTKSQTVTGTPATEALKMLRNAIASAQNAIGYDEELVAFVDSTMWQALQSSSELSRMLVADDFYKGELNTRVNRYNGVAILPVPDSRMKTAYTFNDGTTEGQESGGFAPTTSAKSIGLLLIPRRAASLIKKTEQVRCFDPAHNLQADAWKMDYRLYYDVVLKNGLAKGIYTYTF